MTTLEEELRDSLRASAQAMRVPERPPLDHHVDHVRRRSGTRWLIAAACLTLVGAGIASFVARRDGDSGSVISDVPDTTAPAHPGNGWIALQRSVPDESGESSGIYLVRPGEMVRRLEVAGSDTASDACPAWSPDGTRLLLGRLTGRSEATAGDAELVMVPIGRDGVAGAPTVIALDGFDALEGFDAHPCGTWAPDGRWVALRGPGDVWVVDTNTAEIRRLPDLRPTDLEWRPGSDELAITGDMGVTRAAEWRSTPVTIYSVSTGRLRQLGTFEAGNLTWSPDGSTLAYTLTSDGADGPSGLWLVDADGTDERLLVTDVGRAVHGVGPVWSPTGERIVYQRLCCGVVVGERHEIVLVSVADGTEAVIEPPRAEGLDEVRWFPFDVSWSPDGSTLMATAWRAWTAPYDGAVDGRAHVITLPADGPYDVTVLSLGGTGYQTESPWGQKWGPRPG